MTIKDSDFNALLISRSSHKLRAHSARFTNAMYFRASVIPKRREKIENERYISEKEMTFFTISKFIKISWICLIFDTHHSRYDDSIIFAFNRMSVIFNEQSIVVVVIVSKILKL